MIYFYIVLYLAVGFFFAEIVDDDASFFLILGWPMLFVAGAFLGLMCAIGYPGIWLARKLKKTK